MSILASSSVAHHSIMRAPNRRSLPIPILGLAAALAGLGLRLFLVLRFPAFTDDSALYEELARNWLQFHVYGLSLASGVIPSDIRVPGYPAFLALVSILLGRGEMAIVLAQAALDLVTCFLVAGLATVLAPANHRRRVWLASLWLASTCPFIANYAAVPLAEVLATFFTAAALFVLARGFAVVDRPAAAEGSEMGWGTWFTGGFLAGIGTLVRPETPLLLVAFGAMAVLRWGSPSNWRRLIRVGVFTGLGLILPLLPWAARNAIRLHEVQFLAPRYAASPDEYIPRGLYAWTGTWLVRYRDVYLVPWNIGSVPVHLSDVPDSAFDSPEERARIGALLDRYNMTLKMTPQIDAGFAELARERTARHPLRTYVTVPFGRVLTMWFTPRVELLPVSGHVWPIREKWRRDPKDVIVTLLFGALNFIYVGLALVGLCRWVRRSETRLAGMRWTVLLLLSFVAIRTAFLTQVETPEPRYVLECFPVILALGGLVWLPRSGT